MNSSLKGRIGIKGLATLGLIFITFLAAIQYVFLNTVPETVSSFTFVCVTNLIGIAVLFVSRIRQILKISKRTLKKGAFFAVLLTGFNVFVLLGSQGMDSLVISSVVSLYFVFITPILLLIRKKVNFMSGIATVMAIIALLLMFGGNAEALFQSKKVIYLFVGDIFFASYVVSVSVMGEDEDSTLLTFSQMLFSVVFSLIGLIIEVSMGKATFSLPLDRSFWISAIFIGIFIRAVYGLLQITCQKYVSALSASLIFSTEIIITMLMNPIMSRLLNTSYAPATFYQIVGAVLLIIATLAVDENIMSKFGYTGMEDNSVAKKMVKNTLVFSLVTLVLSTITALLAIYSIRDSTVDGFTKLGDNASGISTSAMTEELENSIIQQVEDKAKLAEQKLMAYSNAMEYASDYAHALYVNADEYPKREVDFAKAENAGKWAMQLMLEDKNKNYDNLRSECELLGNMEDIFATIVRNNDFVTTIYMATESGLMISYDEFSQLAVGEENHYWGYKDSIWYTQAKETGKASFTDTYWDQYGRGLTITCVAPFYDSYNRFAGCVAVDVLMTDLNNSMINDGIVDPNVATLIDDEGNVIASKELDIDAQESYSIFDDDRGDLLKNIGHEIIDKRDGIIYTVDDEEEVYVAFGTIDSTNWTICIASPVSSVIAPALAIRESIDSNTSTLVDTVIRGVLLVIQNLLVLTAVILFILMLTAGRFSRRISDPLKKLTSDVMEISTGNFDKRTDVSTDDEIGSLADSFNNMTDSLQKYIKDLKEVTAKEQRIAGELSAATDIQASMLPRDFAQFCKDRPFTIYASMDPAKEVGGDFYDYFMIDDTHLGLVMADVSGKGVPAALFMVIAKTLIKNRALMGGGPSEILEYVNNQLCEGNDEGLFVTVWFAILDLTTGKGMAVNAGHEYPAIRSATGKYELLNDEHGVVAGVMEDVHYKEYEFALEKGGALFVYTDGVPEATAANDEMFGLERMTEALNEDASAAPDKLLGNVRAAVDRFVGDAPQFDDLTMLALMWK
ncbi:MAG: SpoIIE family protein phosphatase [Lachnospiraceae bacterium]|nr:SpoIIE family protein phosphatase [Lachnospiraceae bacterium]